MRTTSPRILAALLVGGLALAPLAACGSSGSEPVAADGGATTTAASGSESPGDPGDPDEPVSTVVDGTDPADPTAIDPTQIPDAIALVDAELLIGMTEQEATDAAEEREWTLRVARLDGEDLALTEDYSPTRVNVAIVDGLVTEIVSIG